VSQGTGVSFAGCRTLMIFIMKREKPVECLDSRAHNYGLRFNVIGNMYYSGMGSVTAERC